LLMPLLENSFKHGANQMTEHAWISMDLAVERSLLKFKLINGKPNDATSFNESSGVGLKNVQRRLELLYPNAHELRISKDDDTFVVVLTVALDKIKSPDS